MNFTFNMSSEIPNESSDYALAFKVNISEPHTVVDNSANCLV